MAQQKKREAQIAMNKVNNQIPVLIRGKTQSFSANVQALEPSTQEGKANVERIIIIES